ncbi:hypothetical protein Aduo_017258 [Ancylostoma duodenale]
MDGPSTNLEGLIHTALEDVTRSLDIAEFNLRSLTVNPYISARSDPSKTPIPLMEPSAPPVPQHVPTSPCPGLRIPRRYVVSEEYNSRPNLQLDWILSTDPTTVQRIHVARSVPVKRVPASDWIFDTRIAAEHSEQQPQGQSPPVARVQPKMDMEWILSTCASQTYPMREIQPLPESQRVAGSEWIIRTVPDSHGPTEAHDPVHSLEEMKRLQSFIEEENQIRTGNMRSDQALATPNIPESQPPPPGVDMERQASAPGTEPTALGPGHGLVSDALNVDPDQMELARPPGRELSLVGPNAPSEPEQQQITRGLEAPPAAMPEAPPTGMAEAPPAVMPEAPPAAVPEASPIAMPEAPPTGMAEAPLTGMGAPPAAMPEAPPTVMPEAPPTGMAEAPPAVMPEAPPAAMVEAPPAVMAEAPPAVMPEAPAFMPEAPPAVMAEAPLTGMAEAPPTGMAEAPPAVMPEAPPAAMVEAPPAVMAEAPPAVMPEAPAFMPEAPPAVMAEAPLTGMAEAPPTGMAEAPPAVMPEAPPAAMAEAPLTGMAEAPPTGMGEAPPAAMPEAPPAVMPEAPAFMPEAPPAVMAEAPLTGMGEAPPAAMPEAPPAVMPEAPPTGMAEAPPAVMPGVPLAFGAPSQEVEEMHTARGLEAPPTAMPEASSVAVPEAPPAAMPEAPPAIMPEAPPAAMPEAPSAATPEAPPAIVSEAPPTAMPAALLAFGATNPEAEKMHTARELEAPPAVMSEAPPTAMPEAPPAVMPEAPPAVMPEAPPAAMPEAPPAVMPEAPPAAMPEAPLAVMPEAPPAAMPEAPPAVMPEAPPAAMPEAPPAVMSGAPLAFAASNPEAEELHTARGPEAPPAVNMTDSEIEQMQLARGPEAASDRGTRIKRPSFLAEVSDDLNSDDFISPTSASSSVPVIEKADPSRYSSLLDVHRAVSRQLSSIGTERKIATPSPSITKSEKTKRSSWRSKRRARVFQSDYSLKTAVEAKSMARIRLRAKAAYLKARRKKRQLMGHRRIDRSSTVMPTDQIVADDRVIQLGPLRAPISVDSRRSMIRNGEQTNLRQVLRIYGGGRVEEPYDELPRRSSTKYVRGAIASVKYGRNMIEITLCNTAIQPRRRGQACNWTFTHSRDVHTVPLVFARTVLVSKHSPAPFCLSVSAPYWVNVYQEQIGSRRGGERMRESIEIRSCKDSGIACYEMEPMMHDAHPLFKELIYLGKGVIRIDRDVRIPDDQELREFFSHFVSTTVDRQYRIQLPWRQIPGLPDIGIPRAPQITDIRATVRPDVIHPHKLSKDGAPVQQVERSKGKKFKVQRRRRLPPPSCDTTGTTVVSLSREISARPDDLPLARVTSSTFVVVPTIKPEPEIEAKMSESCTQIPDLSTIRKAYLPHHSRMVDSPTAAGSGVLLSPTDRDSSPQHSDREIIPRNKISELPVNRSPRPRQRVISKDVPTLLPPPKLSTARAIESTKTLGKPAELPKKDKEPAQKMNLEEPGVSTAISPGTSSSPGEVFQYAKESDQAQNGGYFQFHLK